VNGLTPSGYPRPGEAQTCRLRNIVTGVATREAAFFDLDKTIIARSSTLAFGKPFYAGGLVNRRAVLKSTYAQFMYLVSGADADQMDKMRDYLKQLCTGWDARQVAEIVAETLYDVVDPLVYDEAVALIEEHRAAGRDIVIVSSSGEEIVAGVGEMLRADHAIGTRMQVVDGRYSGEIEFYAYGPHKAEAMLELAEREGYDLARCYAYSDSATDLPMLEAVGHPTAVNPDKALRRVAAERGWPVLVFRRPVSLRARMSRLSPPRRALVAGAVSLGVAVLATRAWKFRKSGLHSKA
jgi:HAD superfamily hydrolase (TIGR01490 family)